MTGICLGLVCLKSVGLKSIDLKSIGSMLCSSQPASFLGIRSALLALGSQSLMLALPSVSLLFFFFLEVRSHYVTQAKLELTVQSRLVFYLCGSSCLSPPSAKISGVHQHLLFGDCMFFSSVRI